MKNKWVMLFFLFFQFLSNFHQISGFCLGRNFVLCPIQDILGLWMGGIAWITSELCYFFNFSALSIKFSGFCIRKNLILCSILDILGFGLIFKHFPSNFQGLPQEKLNSLLNYGHFRIWIGEIACKMSELQSIFK